MEVHRFVVGQLRTNCYFVVCSQTNQGVIIDPGDEGDFLSEKILQLKISPQMILLTHGHFDHCLAAEELRLNFEAPQPPHLDISKHTPSEPKSAEAGKINSYHDSEKRKSPRRRIKVPIFLHPDDLPLLKNAKKSAFYWLQYFQGKEKILIPQKVKPLKVGESIKFGQEKLRVIHTPGHTPGSVSFHSPKQNLLFSGDVIFKEGFGRTDFSYSSSHDLENSLKKIYSLPPQTLIYPGHGEEFVLGDI